MLPLSPSFFLILFHPGTLLLRPTSPHLVPDSLARTFPSSLSLPLTSPPAAKLPTFVQIGEGGVREARRKEREQRWRFFSLLKSGAWRRIRLLQVIRSNYRLPFFSIIVIIIIIASA